MMMDDRGALRAVKRRHDDMRQEIARHRLGAALWSRRARGDRGFARVRRALGRLLVRFGRVVEGDEGAVERALPCN